MGSAARVIIWTAIYQTNVGKRLAKLPRSNRSEKVPPACCRAALSSESIPRSGIPGVGGARTDSPARGVSNRVRMEPSSRGRTFLRMMGVGCS